MACARSPVLLVRTIYASVAASGDRDLIDAVHDAVQGATRMKEIVSDLAAITQADDSIALIDNSSGRFVEFNESAHRHLGYTRDEFAQTTVFDIDAQLPRETIVASLTISPAVARCV